MATQTDNFSWNIFREHWGRSTVSPELLSDPEPLYERMLAQSLATVQMADHYEDFSVSAVALAFENGIGKMLSGANFKLAPGITYKKCAEQALLDGSHEGDALVGVIMVRGPEQKKQIQGSRPMESLHPCNSCRSNLLEKVGGGILVVTYTGISPTPEEAVPLSALIAYHDEKGPYPRTFGDPKDRALNALAGITIPRISAF